MQTSQTERRTNTSPQKPRGDYENFYSNKSWCDALDKSKVWRLGKIIETKGDSVLVSFDGWSDKHQQWYCKHAAGIAPPRTHSLGYTGQASVPLRDYDLTDQATINGIQILGRKLKLFESDAKLLTFDGFKLTSFVRGDLYVTVDSILTYKALISAQDCSTISNFLKQVVNLSLKWMNVAISTYQAMRKEIGVNNVSYLEEIRSRRLHVTSRITSLYMCGYEIFLTLKSIFGCDKRCTTFYEKNNLTINTKDIINLFLSNQGLNKVIELLTYEDKEIPQGTIEFSILWPLIYSIPFLFNKIVWISWEKPLQRFIDVLYLRLKKEIENDYQFKVSLGKNPEFQEFVDALTKINARISPEPLKIGDLFNFSFPNFNKQESAILPTINGPSMNNRYTRNSDFILTDYNDDNDDIYVDQDDDDFIETNVNQSSPPKTFIPPLKVQHEHSTESTIVKEALAVGNKGGEIDELKQQLINLQLQMSNLQKSLGEVTQGQDTFKSSLNQTIDKKLQKSEAKIQKETVATAPVDEYLECFRKSGLTPEEFETCLGYVRQVNEVVHVDEKSIESMTINPLTVKVGGKVEFAKYEELSLGGSEDELKILTALEYYISNSKLLDATKLIKWRKKIIKLATMNGWDVASIIAQRTLEKQDIDANDIIMSNLCLMQKMENVVGFGFDDDEYDDLEEVDEEQQEL